MNKRALVFMVLACACASAFADVPVRTENLIYTVLAANGRDFTPTFAREASGTIYLIAGTDNFLSVRKVLVYFWPLTGEWKTDTDNLNMQMDGSLEVQGPRGKTSTVPLTLYTYYNVRGEYELNWKVARGEEAAAVLAHWGKLYDDYTAAVRAYQKKSMQYETELNSLIARVTRLRNAGKNVDALVEQMTNLKKPVEPEQPSEYVVPPVEPQAAFILNLPPGTYHVRLRQPDGSILEGSEKTLVVFEKRRAGGIGYEVIPGDKWTRPVESLTPSSVLYVNGSTDLFLQPFFEDEFNDLYYAKAQSNEAKGNANLMRWVRIQQVPKARIRLAGSGASRQIGEESFLVQQTKGTTLGYTIVPFDPKNTEKGKEPNLIAFRIPRDSTARVDVATLDKNGSILNGSERQIRVVNPGRGQAPVLILILVPIAVMVVVLSLRARRYGK